MDKAPHFQLIIPRAPDDAETADSEWPVTVRFSAVEGFTSLLKPEAPTFARPVPKLPDPESILTPAQVAEHLQIPMKTVIFLCAEGRLVGAFKAGRRWRIPGRAVRLMATQAQ